MILEVAVLHGKSRTMKGFATVDNFCNSIDLT